MAFDAFAYFRRRVIQQIHSRQSSGPKLMYIEVRYRKFDKSLIYVYVHNLPPWGQCRAGFRGALPLEEFGDHVVGIGDATIVCESPDKRRCSRANKHCIQVQQVQVRVEEPLQYCWNSVTIPHNGIADIGILVLGGHRIHIIVKELQSLAFSFLLDTSCIVVEYV